MKKIPLKDIFPVFLSILNLVLAVVLILNIKRSVEVGSQAAFLQKSIDELKKAKLTIKNFDEVKFKKEEKALKKVFIDQTVPLEAMKEIVNIARVLGIQDINISQKQESRKSDFESIGVKTLSFETRLGCEYTRLEDFLKKVADSPILINVRSLQVSRLENKLPNLDIRIVLDTYSIISKEKAVKKTPPTPR
jgi:hypothetical protein